MLSNRVRGVTAPHLSLYAKEKGAPFALESLKMFCLGDLDFIKKNMDKDRVIDVIAWQFILYISIMLLAVVGLDLGGSVSGVFVCSLNCCRWSKSISFRMALFRDPRRTELHLDVCCAPALHLCQSLGWW